MTELPAADGSPVVKLDGRLDASTVEVLGGLAGGLTIDLSGLVAVDRAGRDRLAALQRRGSRLVGASLYLRRLLEEVE